MVSNLDQDNMKNLFVLIIADFHFSCNDIPHFQSLTTGAVLRNDLLERITDS